MLHGRAVNWDSRVQAGLASPRPLGLILKLRSPPIRLAIPRVPASPREASPRVQKVGLVSALVHGTHSFKNIDNFIRFHFLYYKQGGSKFVHVLDVISL